MKEGLKVKVRNRGKELDGYFVQWFVESYPVPELRGPSGHAAGQVNTVKGLVVLSNGTAGRVDPEDICFENLSIKAFS